jgi:hypothetical protein
VGTGEHHWLGHLTKLFGKIKFTELRSDKHLEMIGTEFLQTRHAVPALGGGGCFKKVIACVLCCMQQHPKVMK